MSHLDILSRYWPAFLKGALTTLSLAALIWFMGLLLGVTAGYLGSQAGWSRRSIRAIAFTVSTFPPLVVLFWAHYPLQAILGVVWRPLWVAAGSLGFLNAALVSELTVAALRQVPREYRIAAEVLGLSPRITNRRIVWPLFVRVAAAPVLQLQFIMLQSTFFAAFISVPELFRTALQINAGIYRPVEVFTLLALFVFAICLPINATYWLLTKGRLRDLSRL